MAREVDTACSGRAQQSYKANVLYPITVEWRIGTNNQIYHKTIRGQILKIEVMSC